MSIYGKGVMVGGGKKPIPLSVSNNGTWSRDGGYNPVTVSVRASEVTSGTKSITANGDYDVTEFKNANVNVPASAVTSGTKVITANGDYDVTEFKNVRVTIMPQPPHWEVNELDDSYSTICYGDQKFVALTGGNSYTEILYSTDGIKWNKSTAP